MKLLASLQSPEAKINISAPNAEINSPGKLLEERALR